MQFTTQINFCHDISSHSLSKSILHQPFIEYFVLNDVPPNSIREQAHQSIITQETKLALPSHPPLTCVHFLSDLNKLQSIQFLRNQRNVTQAHDFYFPYPYFTTSRHTHIREQHPGIRANLSFLSHFNSQTSLYSLAFHWSSRCRCEHA